VELRVEPERAQAAARAGEIHLLEERLLRLRRGDRGERRRDGDESDYHDEYERWDWASRQTHRGTLLRQHRTVNPPKGGFPQVGKSLVAALGDRVLA
jgi:hypothetical protein